MRLGYAQELVLAVGAGIGLARFRLTGPDLGEIFWPLTWVNRFEVGIDAFLAGLGLAGGLGTLVERARGKSPESWGPGRWAWCLVAAYVCLTLLDQILGEVAFRHTQPIEFRNTLTTIFLQALRGEDGLFLIPSMTWFFLALGLTSLASRSPRHTTTDAREWAGRSLVALILTTGIGLRALVLLGIRQEGMGGGMQ